MSNSCLGAEGTEARGMWEMAWIGVGQSRGCSLGAAWECPRVWRGHTVLPRNCECFSGLHSAEQGPWLELSIQVGFILTPLSEKSLDGFRGERYE